MWKAGPELPSIFGGLLTFRPDTLQLWGGVGGKAKAAKRQTVRGTKPAERANRREVRRLLLRTGHNVLAPGLLVYVHHGGHGVPLLVSSIASSPNQERVSLRAFARHW